MQYYFNYYLNYLSKKEKIKLLNFKLIKIPNYPQARKLQNLNKFVDTNKATQ